MFEGSGGAALPRVSTMPPEILNSDKIEVPGGLERSKTERERRTNVLAEEAAQIFDERISVQDKVMILSRNP